MDKRYRYEVDVSDKGVDNPYSTISLVSKKGTLNCDFRRLLTSSQDQIRSITLVLEVPGFVEEEGRRGREFPNLMIDCQCIVTVHEKIHRISSIE